MRILGINSAYHESSAALIIDGRIVAAAEEERFSRVKHAKPARIDNADELPFASMRFCLESAGLNAADLDGIAYSFDPDLREREFILDNRSVTGDWGTAEGEQIFISHLRAVPEALGKLLGPEVEQRLSFVPHHIAHAASTFYPSGFDDAAILVVDGIGEAACTLLARGDRDGISPLREVPFPHSVGFLWEKVSQYLGFSEYDACKVMGLAAYGDPIKLKDAFSQLMRVDVDGYAIDPAIANFRLPDFDYQQALFGPARSPHELLLNHHYDIAASLQAATDAAILSLVQELRRRTGSKNLCLAGGVALNCVTNMAVKESGLFSNVFIPTAPHDAGTAIGAALQLNHDMGGKTNVAIDTPYLGPEFNDDEIDEALRAAGLSPELCDSPAREAARMIASGKVVAWFQGRMEFGPRALGNRSLLADPRTLATRETLNVKVKHREVFRPFAPSVLAENANEWFDLGQPSKSYDFMLFACQAKLERQAKIPAVLHEDRTARVQLVSRDRNPAFHELISHFADLTGVPIVLNTSLNDSEPIVCTPADAIATFQKTAIDALFIGNRFVTRESGASGSETKELEVLVET